MPLIDWPQYVELEVAHLKTEAYQREVDEKRVRKMQREFDINLFGALTIATLDNGYAVIDGSHRWELAKLMAFETVWAQLHEDLDYQARALLFVELQRQRRNLTTVDRFLAMREAQDPRTLEMDEAIKRHGFEIHRNPDHIGGIRAMTAIEEAYRKKVLEQVLDTARRWPKIARFRTHTEVLRGLCRFYAQHQEVDPAELSDLLEREQLNPLALRAMSAEIRSTGNLPKGGTDNALSVGLTRVWKDANK